MTFLCTKCPAEYNELTKLKTHLAKLSKYDPTHSLGKPYKCGWCKKCFKNFDNIKFHMANEHSGKFKKMVDLSQKNLKNFECNICNKKLTTKYKLRDHIGSIHEEKKLFQCK